MQRTDRNHLATALIVAAIVALGSGAALAQDPVKVAPEIYKLKFENDRARVLEIVVKPGAKIGMHSHPEHVVYVVTPGKLKITTSEGKVTDLDAKAGDVIFIGAETHEAVNVGTTEMKAVIVELKPQAMHEKGAAAAAEHPASKKEEHPKKE